MTDQYDDAIVHLTENPELIRETWGNPEGYTAGCLFTWVTPDGEGTQRDDGMYCGCLTQIRNGGFHSVSWWSSLTNLIRWDKRIPTEGKDITVEDLPVFAEWQRIIDTQEGN
jgi:hypothetical protein